jgi:hypothetical protein
VSCGTCPTSAQPTTRKDGTASTPGSLLWSADVGAWYRRQRAQGQQPAITMPAAAAPVDPPRRSHRPGTAQEQAAREILLAEAGPPHDLSLAGDSVAEEIAHADDALLYYNPEDDTTRLLLAIGKYLVWIKREPSGALVKTDTGPYVSPQHVQRQFDDEARILEALAKEGIVQFHCLRCGSQIRSTDGVCVDCPGAP